MPSRPLRSHPRVPSFPGMSVPTPLSLSQLTTSTLSLQDFFNPFLYRHLVLFAHPRRPHPSGQDRPSALQRLVHGGLALTTPSFPPPTTPLAHTLTLDLVPPFTYDPTLAADLNLVLLNAYHLQRFATRAGPGTLFPPIQFLVPTVTWATFFAITKLVGVTVLEAFLPHFVTLLHLHGQKLIQLDVTFAVDRNSPQERYPPPPTDAHSLEWTTHHLTTFTSSPPPVFDGLRLLTIHLVQSLHHDTAPAAVLSRGGYSGSRTIAFLDWVLRRPSNFTQLVHLSLLSGPPQTYLPTVSPFAPPPTRAFLAVASRCARTLQELHLGPLFTHGLDPSVLRSLPSLVTLACSVASLDVFSPVLRSLRTLGLWIDLPNPYLQVDGHVPLALSTLPNRTNFPRLKRLFWLATSTEPWPTAPTATFPAGQLVPPPFQPPSALTDHIPLQIHPLGSCLGVHPRCRGSPHSF